MKRSEAKLEVTYDGDPQFKQIPDTAIEYALNSPQTVLKIGGKFYCCDQAVWFFSSSAQGPWAVCDEVPKEVKSIPPDNPAYNVTYVEVYDSTPDIFYVGYTPGYMCCYP